MAAWPSYARILTDGFSRQRQAAVQRSEMESGPPKQSRTLSRVLVQRKCTVHFTTQADYLSFLTWFRDDIRRGADWFDWTDEFGAATTARIVGGALEAEAPVAFVGGAWRVSLTLETWDA